MSPEKATKISQIATGISVVLMAIGGMYTGVVQLPSITKNMQQVSQEGSAATAKAVSLVVRAELRPLQRELASNSAAIVAMTKRIGENSGRIGVLEYLPRGVTRTAAGERGER